MIKYIEYIEVPSQTRVGWDTGVKITSLDDEVYLDFMPLEGQGTDDNWYAYVCDSENNIVIRSGSNIPQTQIGVSFGNFRTYIDRQTVVLANKNERNVLYLSKSSFQNLTSGTSIQLSATELIVKKLVAHPLFKGLSTRTVQRVLLPYYIEQMF